MLVRLVPLFMLLVAAGPGDDPPLIEPAESVALAAELSGSSAKRTVQALSLHHRMRGSEGFNAAAELIRARLAEYGLAEVEMIRLPADGKIFYGTQRSRPAWNASFAELWEQRQEGGRWSDAVRLASWAEQPISLAQDSVSGKAEAELVDVGTGTAEADYAGKAVRGKLVLVSAQPGEAAPLAVGKHKAAGIVSWAQNQRQAWWGEDEDLIRWGHLDTWEHPTFAFMVSPGRARAWKERLAKGETVRLRAEVEAGRTPGAYLIPTAVIPGRERDKEIVFSCHLDHPSPGANDNASGCAGILEIARAFSRLIADGRLPKPRRTIRFVWPAEIEGTIALLNARPEFVARTLATVHLDMIGGDTEITKSILWVEGPPPSLPSIVGDVGFAIARWVNDQTLRYASTGSAAYPLTDPEGGKRALQAQVGGFSEGSDHQVWTEGSFRIPALYIADWPDRYIHTQKDVPANLDPTKMKRAMFIAAASAWVLANLDQSDAGALDRVMDGEGMFRGAEEMRRAAMIPALKQILLGWMTNWETALIESFDRFGLKSEAYPITEASPDVLQFLVRPDVTPVYWRRPEPKGPMDAFGYSWFDDHLKRAGLERPKLLDREPAWGGASFGYEALNLVDGERTLQDIADDLTAGVGPAPLEEVAQYLTTLERLGVIQRIRR
jgi:aminopeptidase YwaD